MMTGSNKREKAAKEAFAEMQNNEKYDFECAEMANEIFTGVLETVYRQAFFAGVNWGKKRELERRSLNTYEPLGMSFFRQEWEDGVF